MITLAIQHSMKLLENINEFDYKVNFYVFDDITYYSYTYLCKHPNNDNFILALKNSNNSMKEFRINDINDLIKNKRIVIGDYDEIFLIEHRIALMENKIKQYKDRIQYIKESKNVLNINDLKITK